MFFIEQKNKMNVNATGPCQNIISLMLPSEDSIDRHVNDNTREVALVAQSDDYPSPSTRVR